MTDPFFIIGCQRSGTTLLRLMLNAHSQVAIPEEGGFWMPLLRAARHSPERGIPRAKLDKYLRYIRNNSQFHLWEMDPEKTIEKIWKYEACTLSDLMSAFYVSYATSYGKTMWGDKTPNFLRMIPVLDDLFPNCRFVQVVRDGRDIYASWKKMRVHRRNPSVGAFEWVHKVKMAKRKLNGIPRERCCEVRYEDLVARPEETLSKVCNFLGIEYDPAMLAFWNSSHKFIGVHHSQLIFRPVSTSSVGKWKHSLSAREVKNFEAIAAPTLTSLDYEVSAQHPEGFGLPVSSIVELACGLPRRLWAVGYTAVTSNIASRLGLTHDTARMRKRN